MGSLKKKTVINKIADKILCKLGGHEWLYPPDFALYVVSYRLCNRCEEMEYIYSILDKNDRVKFISFTDLELDVCSLSKTNTIEIQDSAIEQMISEANNIANGLDNDNLKG